MPSKTVVVGSAVGLHARPAAIISEAFDTGLPPAVTPPASIAARARARLSNRPRSTSSTSTRLRADVSLSLLSANVSPICVRTICVSSICR